MGKVVFRATGAKAFSVKVFPLPLAHHPTEGDEHRDMKLLLMTLKKVHAAPEM